jgi:uncharacterized membrane protein YsdA (DUF1294 family)
MSSSGTPLTVGSLDRISGRRELFGIGIGTLFLAVICGLAALGRLPSGIPAAYLAASAAAAIAYGNDKSAAQSGAWRVPERTLHVLALMGGWPGALVAQRVFRHKSQKPSFRFAFWVTVTLNCGALVLFWWIAASDH